MAPHTNPVSCWSICIIAYSIICIFSLLARSALLSVGTGDVDVRRRWRWWQHRPRSDRSNFLRNRIINMHLQPASIQFEMRRWYLLVLVCVVHLWFLLGCIRFARGVYLYPWQITDAPTMKPRVSRKWISEELRTYYWEMKQLQIVSHDIISPTTCFVLRSQFLMKGNATWSACEWVPSLRPIRTLGYVKWCSGRLYTYAIQTTH